MTDWSNSEGTVLYSTLQFTVPGALREHFPMEFKYIVSYEAYTPLQSKEQNKKAKQVLSHFPNDLHQFNFYPWLTASNPVLCYSLLYCEISFII